MQKIQRNLQTVHGSSEQESSRAAGHKASDVETVHMSIKDIKSLGNKLMKGPAGLDAESYRHIHEKI